MSFTLSELGIYSDSECDLHDEFKSMQNSDIKNK